MIRVSVSTGTYVKYQIEWEVDGEGHNYREKTSLRSDLGLTIVPLYLSMPYRIKVEV